ncbi:type II toxin-antitoxin system HicB family antitoxin [Aliamphritea hakodatensis]|uniref:type II toxin-antitoxin system HicB family antitoxin n=1 Tax=Aliamphritea hakodatensis TaxID=2895352 RepID=UPI0022FD7795|nr:type II toxin-antitoxin system HicB family antitoxin [Aliamphritea hakodatensis]
MRYSAIIEKDGSGFIAKFPDIPEALAGGETYEETIQEAQDALITAFEFYFEDQRPVPEPSKTNTGEPIEVPLSVWTKVLLLNTMLEQGVSQSELARRMGTRRQEIQRIVDLHHTTKIDTLSQALQALDKRFSISIS